MTPRPVMFVVSGLLTAGLLQVNVGGQGSGQTAGPAPGESLSQSYRGSQGDNVAYQKIAPFKVFDNLYYVGPGSVVGLAHPDDRRPDSHRLHAGAPGRPRVDSIRKVGFDPRTSSTSFSRTATSITSAASENPGALGRARCDA